MFCKKQNLFIQILYSDYRKTMSKNKLTPINETLIQQVISEGRITIPTSYRKFHKIEDGDTVKIILLGVYKNNGGDDEDAQPDSPSN